jgi:outer membrane protein assembly factor BamB
MNKSLCLLALSFLCLDAVQGTDWPQWRGPDRSGVSQEIGLLKSWPSVGPKLLWEGGAVGEGFSSLAIVNGRIFTMGDKAGQSFLFCLNQKGGALLWSLKVGKSGGNYSGTRCTPTVDEDLVFALGQFGDLVCVDIASGQERWRKNLASDFGGKSGGWNYSESVLVDGNNLMCSPGGNQATALALNKRTGSVVWKTALPGGGESHYSSWVVSNGAGIKQYVRLFAGGTFGVAAANGKFLWRYDKLGSNTANIPTPIPFGDYVFTAAGYGKGGALLKLARKSGGIVAEEVYFSRELKNKHGGIVKVGNYVYGDFDDRGSPWCADVMTGQVKWRRDGGGQGSGSACVTYADGHLYFRYQDGIMGLVDPSPQGGFRQISSFKIPDGMKKSWAHPVISGGLLYLRGMNKILCYDLRDPSRAAVPASPMRLWTDDTGKFEIKAVFKGVKEGKVLLEQADGVILKVPFARLSSSDQNYLREL